MASTQISYKQAVQVGVSIAGYFSSKPNVVFVGLHGSLIARHQLQARDADFIVYLDAKKNIGYDQDACDQIEVFREQLSGLLNAVNSHKYICENFHMIGTSYITDEYRYSLHFVSYHYIKEVCATLSIPHFIEGGIFDLAIFPQRAYRLWVEEVLSLQDKDKFFTALPVCDRVMLCSLVVPQLAEKARAALHHLKKTVSGSLYYHAAYNTLCNHLIALAYAKNHKFIGTIKHISQDIESFSNEDTLIDWCKKLLFNHDLNSEDSELMEIFLTGLCI